MSSIIGRRPRVRPAEKYQSSYVGAKRVLLLAFCPVIDSSRALNNYNTSTVDASSNLNIPKF